MRLKLIFVLLLSCHLASAVESACTNEPDGTFLADPSSRSNFIFCWGGSEIIGQCEPGLEFNPFDRFCDVPRGGGPIIPPQRDPCIGRPDGTFLPDPDTRQGFLFCTDGLSARGSCDPGFEFNPRDSVCEWATQQRDPCFGQRDGTFLPDPNSRQGFLWCSGGVSTRGSCEQGQVFNARTSMCEFDNQPPPVQRDACFGLPDGTFLADPDSRQGFLWCSRGVSTRGSCEQGLVFNARTSMCEIDTQQPTPRDPCFGHPDGTFLPDPTSRQRFLWCTGGIATPGTCPDGTEFDAQGLFCDAPRNPETTTRAPPRPPPGQATTTRAPPRPPPGQATTTRAPPRPPPGPPRPPPGQTTRAALPPRPPVNGPAPPPPRPPAGQNPPASLPRPPPPRPPAGQNPAPVPPRSPTG